MKTDKEIFAGVQQIIDNGILLQFQSFNLLDELNDYFLCLDYITKAGQKSITLYKDYPIAKIKIDGKKLDFVFFSSLDAYTIIKLTVLFLQSKTYN